MTAPIPLTDPAGDVRGYACSGCGAGWSDRVNAERCLHDPRRGPHTCLPRGSSWTPCLCAEIDKTERPCVVCKARSEAEAECPVCSARGRRAFEVLAAIGMAVAAQQYALAVENGGDGADVEHPDEALAALCGVDVETVRGWR